MQQEYKFLIPIERSSDRKPQSDLDWDWLDNQLANVLGGFTKGANVFDRWWDEDHNLVFGESTPFYVSVREPVESNKCKLFNILHACCQRFDQQTIYLRKPDGSTILIDR